VGISCRSAIALFGVALMLACGESRSSGTGGTTGAGGSSSGGVGGSVSGGSGGTGGGLGGSSTGGSVAGGSGGSAAGGSATGGGAGGACVANSTCDGYCAHLETVCAGLEAVCVADCAETDGYVPADCQAGFESYVACASCATIECPGQVCNNGVCIDQPLKVSGCDAELAAFQACAGACLSHPIVEGGGNANGSFAYTTSRCECPASTKPGKPAGQGCGFSDECAEVCCNCPTGHGNYLVQACTQGTCPDAASACSSALSNPFIADFCPGN